MSRVIGVDTLVIAAEALIDVIDEQVHECRWDEVEINASALAQIAHDIQAANEYWENGDPEEPML